MCFRPLETVGVWHDGECLPLPFSQKDDSMGKCFGNCAPRPQNSMSTLLCYGYWTYKAYGAARPLFLPPFFCEKTRRKPKSMSSTIWSLRLRLSQKQNQHHDEGSRKAGDTSLMLSLLRSGPKHTKRSSMLLLLVQLLISP